MNNGMENSKKAVAPSLCIIIPVIKQKWIRSRFFDLLKQLDYPVIIVHGKKIDFSAGLIADRWTCVPFGRWKGKGAAIEKGMMIAAEHGHQMALTLDCRETVSLEDLNKIISKKYQINAVTIGIRPMASFDGHPLKRRIIKVSNFLYWLETGIHCADSRSSIRLYPVELVNKIRLRFHRRVWELEALVRAVWCGLKIKPVDLPSYEVPEEVTPIKKMSDYVDVMGIHGYLILRRLIPWPFKQLVKKKELVWPGEWKGKLKFIWTQFFWKTRETPGEIALSVAVGIFSGLLPNLGTQSFVAVYFAQRLHLNKVLVLLGSLITLTPLLPVVIYLDLLIGHGVKTNVWQAPLGLEKISWQGIKIYMAEFVTGSIIVAILVSIIIGVLVYSGLQLLRKIKYQQKIMRRGSKLKPKNDNQT